MPITLSINKTEATILDDGTWVSDREELTEALTLLYGLDQVPSFVPYPSGYISDMVIADLGADVLKIEFPKKVPAPADAIF